MYGLADDLGCHAVIDDVATLGSRANLESAKFSTGAGAKVGVERLTVLVGALRADVLNDDLVHAGGRLETSDASAGL